MKKQVLCGLLAAVLAVGLLFSSSSPLSAAPAATGDVNGDGCLNSTDARLILRYDAGGASLSRAQLAAADLTGNGAVNQKDADALWMLIVKADRTAAVAERTGTTAAEMSDGAEISEEESAEVTSTTASRTTEKTTEKKSTTVKKTTDATEKTTVKTTKKTTKKTTEKTTAKPTAKTTAKKTTAKPTTKKTTKKTTAGKGKAQSVPTVTAVLSPPAVPKMKVSPVKESVYMEKIRVVNNRTGKVYTGKTKKDLQLAVTADVKYELGNSRNGSISTEAWKAHAVASYTRICSVCYDGSAFGINLAQDVDLSNANDKKIYDAVGKVLGIKLMIPSASGNAGKLCTVFYNGSCAGTTASCHKVYVANLPYCQSVFSPETEARVDHYYGTTGNYISTYTDTFDNILNDVEDLVGHTVHADSKAGLFPLYTKEWDGAYVYRTNLYYYDGDGDKVYVKGTQIRSALGLRSHSFVVTAQSGNKLTLTVTGYGHGVGLSQMGAVIYANDYDWTYDQILTHYFSVTSKSSHQLCLPNW